MGCFLVLFYFYFSHVALTKNKGIFFIPTTEITSFIINTIPICETIVAKRNNEGFEVRPCRKVTRSSVPVPSKCNKKKSNKKK